MSNSYIYFYFLICSYSVFTALFCNEYINSRKFYRIKNKYFIQTYLLFSILFILLLGLRGNEDEYSRIFLRVPDLLSLFDTGYYSEIITHGLILEKGPLMILIMSLIHTLTFGSQLFLFLYVSISISLTTFLFKKLTPFYPIAFLFYISHGLVHKEWVGLRMAIISALLLAIIYFIASNKKINAWILIIVSILNHYIAIVSIALIYMNRHIPSKAMIICIAAAIVISFFNLPLFLINFTNLQAILPQFIGSYLTSEAYGYNLSIYNAKAIQQIITLFLILYFIHGKNSEVINDKYYNLIINTYFLSTLLMFLFSFSGIFAYRFGGYLYVVEPVVLTYFIVHLNFKKIMVLLIITFSLLISMYNYVYLKRVSDYNLFIDNIEIENDHERVINEIMKNQLKL